MTERLRALVFSPLSLSFPIQNLFFVRVRALVFIRFGDPFAAHDRNQTGCRILGEERNQNFLPVQWGRFLSKDSVYALQLRLYLSSLNFFSCAYCML